MGKQINEDDMKAPGETKKSPEPLPRVDTDLDIALSKIAECLKAAEEELKKITPLKGVAKLQGEKAQSLLQGFKDGFDKARKEVKEYTDTVPGSPIRDFADQRSAEQYEKSPIGRLEKFAKDQLKKVEKIFEEPVNAIKNNKILNAVADVIKCSCKAVSTIVKSTLNNAIAVGKVAESVVNLGSTIKNAAMGKGTQQSMTK
ncbi:hypothetical protein [Candidatus Tisiphia endosymbiont of Hybos culiciformis]|uniref:hypothetical protein n=1 Tax=Candidatus Tisiphia endosymbiont of Hybos culiciformis TaxID=3139331 RepID=UPI003CCAB8D7